VSVKRIAAAVAKDPVLAMQVIRMANSAASASATHIADLNDAVVRLGTQTVRNTVVAGCLNAQLVDPRVYGSRGREIVDHCLGTALIASSLGKRHGTSGEMFLGGLLHDIGKLLILKLAHDVRMNSENAPLQHEVDAMLTDRHAQMGGWLAARWSMPLALGDPIVWHHAPEWAEDRASAMIIYSANRLAHRYGFGCEPEPEDLLADPVFAELGIGEIRLAALDAEAPALYNTTKHILQM
jgi:HD-like signal output (HDOD) protein